MPTINKPFLLKFLLAVAVATGALFGLHALQAQRIPDALKRQADRASENGKPDAAVHYLRQYLEFRPTDTDAREQLATLVRTRPSGGDPTELLFLYDKVLRADPDRHAVRREALTVCLRLSRFSDAEAHAGVLLTAFPTDPELWAKQGAAQAGLNKKDDARKSYEAALRHDPKSPVAYQRLAQFLWRDVGRPDEARAVLDRLVAALPHEAEGYLTRAKFDTFVNDAASPMADLRKALEVDPENADALLMMAEQLQKGRDLAGARDCLTDGVRLWPQDVRMVRALAWLELNRGSVGAAVAVLEDGLERIKDGGFELLVPLGDLLVQLGETARTEEIVKRLEGKGDKSSRMQTKYLKARLAMRKADWPGAVAILDTLKTDAVGLPGLEAQTNLLLAACHQRRGDRDAEQDALKLILNRDPGHLAARVGLGQAYLHAGKFADAEKEYGQAVRSVFASGATHATLVRLKAARLRAAGNTTSPEWDALDNVAKELTRAYGPAAPEPALLRAELAVLRGDPAKAVAILKEETVRRPGEARLWAALASAVADVAGVAAGLGVLDEAQAAAGDGPDVRLARADLYARDPARLRPVGPLGDHIDTWPDADQQRLLYGLLEVYDRLGDDAGVVKVSRRIAARRPGDLTVWEALAERAYRCKDEKAANEARAAISKLDSTGKSVTLCDAWAALAAGSATEAGKAAEAVTKAFGEAPDRAEACVVLGRLKEQSGDATAAGKLFDRAARLDPSRFAPAQEALVHAALAPGGDAGPILARLGYDPRWAGEPFRRAVLASVRRLPPDAAKRVLDAARPQLEPLPGGLGWLGDAYLVAKQPQAAADCFRKATSTARPSPDDWLRLALRTAEAGDSGASERALAAARKQLPPALFLNVAVAFADSPAAPKGWAPDLTTAAEKRAFAQARLSLKLSRYQRTEAAELLEAFLKGKSVPAADAAWARRNLAMLLVIRGGRADRTKAMELLAQANGSVGETPDEKRATAAVLAALSRYLDGGERQDVLERAAAVLTELFNETKSHRDAFLLAQMYRAAGNRKASTGVMNQLLAADPTNLDYLVFGLEELTEAGNFPLAEPFAQRLLALYPNDFRVVAAAARYECKAGRSDRGLALAEGYTRTADATAGDLPAKQARAAELLDELARLPNVRRTDPGHRIVKAAVERYEALAAARPEAAVAAAGLAAADGRTADGFAIIDRYTRGQAARLKAAAGLAVLRAGGATDRQFATVRGWLDAALAEEPDSIPLKLNDGEFWALKQDYAAAERAYEAVLTADPRNVVALNNLAWILAPRPEASDRALELVDRAVAEVGLTGELLDTRARVRIAAKQFPLAERDLKQALMQEKTPLRLFHLALAKQAQSPPAKSEARDAFKQARDRGLEPDTVHPADLPIYRVLASDRVD